MDFMLNVQGRYVCWDSYRAVWYLGPKRLSEWFAADFRNGRVGARAEKALEWFPTAKAVWRRS